MQKVAYTIAWAAAGLVLVAGCTSSPWSAARPADRGQQAANSGAEADASLASMQSLMAELQQLGALDPEAQAALMEDLRQTDPAYWPAVTQQFRAALAYRRRMAAQPVAGSVVDESGAVRHASASMPIGPGADTVGETIYQPSEGATPGAIAGQVARLPAADDAALTPTAAPLGEYPATRFAAGEPRVAGQMAEPGRLPDEVRQVSNTMVAPPDRPNWQNTLDAAIGSLETQVDATPDGPDEVAQHARLRMLYLLAGRRDDAVAPIPSAPPALQEYWSKQIYSLATWLDTQRTADDATRAAETKRILEEAVARLGESATLVVRNLAFCTEVQSYGCVKHFATDEFVPGQETLLYAEVENFASEPTADGYHTTLRSSYQIFDSRGQRVAEHTFSDTEEFCRNPRRDFFIGYRLSLPNRIYPGRHTLQLTIEDMTSHKVGQSSIEFSIKDTDE